MFGIVPKMQSIALQKVPQNGFFYRWFSSETGPFTGKNKQLFKKSQPLLLITLYLTKKLVYFYCNTIKWFITLTNAVDILTPVERISTFQQSAMLGTGLVWARWSTQIIPINYGLMGANIAMASIATIQLYRKQQAGQLLE